MLIDKSHSKRDIIILFEKHGVVINDELTKSNIVNDIDIYIKDFKYDEYIKNCTELKEYLKNVSPKQRPNTNLKNEIMFKAKKIIKWGKNNYIFDGATYMDSEEPYNDIMSIYMWGDLPSVRRACKVYNYSPCCSNHINPIITKEVEDELNNNKIIKQQVIYKLKVRHAEKGKPFLVRFD